MAPLPMLRVRAVRGACVPYETDPRRYVGLRRERGEVDEVLVMHRIEGVLADGKNRGGKSLDVVFVAETDPVEVPQTSYYVRAISRRELVLA